MENALNFDGGSIATYREMIEALDRNIGKVLAALDASGRAQNTIVVFTSDNGGERFAKVWPFNGMKGELLEGGIRTPLIVRWPARVPAGVISQQTAISMDWLPTFAAAAGVRIDASAPPDGIDLIPALLNPAACLNRTLFWRHRANNQAAARRGRWKYLSINGAEYLFDVVADPQERANRKGHEPTHFAELKKAWQQWNGMMLPYAPVNTSWDNKAWKSLADRY